ncbi:DUF6090 family protein [Portibacter marinus]|uniref:DUF6090 family protein n=1 Tax=Portibacter marinus TaxID=2898660 RepID=UPI001F2BE9B1|nr:DUF6090 family protein [Portibacter marinus]
MSENKTGKYFKYAIGEIILVVVGILIALQVNNWNEKRKLNNEGKEILTALQAEFTSNRKVLKERIQNLEEANQYVELVLQFVGSNEARLQSENTVQ